MRPALLLFLLLPLTAHAVSTRSPASCRSVVRSKLGEHLRETAFDLKRTRQLLTRALKEHNERCQEVRGDLTQTQQLSHIEKVSQDVRKAHAQLQDLTDEYLRTAQTAAEAAHLLGEKECEERIQEQRKSLEAEVAKRSAETGIVLNLYCR